MGTNGFSERGGKLGKHALSRGSRFDPIDPGSQHQRVDDFDLALAAPGSVAKSEAQLSGFVNALVDGCAKKARTQAKLPTKIPHGHENLNFGTNVDPVPVPEDGSGGSAGAEMLTVGGRDLRPQGMKEAKGSSVCSLHLAGMASANAVNQQIVSKGPRGAVHGFDEVGPRVEQEGHHGHAERASLGDAAWVKVWYPEAATNSVVVKAGGVEVGVGVERTSGEASELKETDEQPELDLVEALVNVGAAAADLLALQFGVLELKVDDVPRIFSTERRSRPSKEGIGLPGLDPRSSTPQGRHAPDSVTDR